jgi:hypothetical protein
LAIDPGDRILLPSEVKSVRVESSRHNRLGGNGDLIPWPITKDSYTCIDLRVVGHPRQQTADMLYTGPLMSGWCGLYRTGFGREIVFRFDPEKLPCVGLWLCYGGWPNDSLNKQVAVALEPTVAARGSLEDAIRDGLAPTLGPEGMQSWSIEIHVSEPNEILIKESIAAHAM